MCSMEHKNFPHIVCDVSCHTDKLKRRPQMWRVFLRIEIGNIDMGKLLYDASYHGTNGYVVGQVPRHGMHFVCKAQLRKSPM